MQKHVLAMMMVVFAGSGVSLGQAAAPAASVSEGYKVPTVTVPYAYAKPTLDGAIDDAEWQGAESTNALQTTRREVSPRQTRFWMMWDEDHLYVAMRSPLREGERVIQRFRDTNKDINVVFDDSYEVWLDVGTVSPDGQPVFFQYLANYAGGRYDVLHEPAVGNSRLGWTANWNPANRVTPDGRFWEFEMAIPRQSVHKTTPFAEGFRFTCLVARNFKNPWEQNSFEGTGSFAVRESHSQFVCSKTAPAVHLLGVADPAAKTLGVKLAAAGTVGDGSLQWTFRSDGGVEKSGTLQYAKGKLSETGSLDLDTPGKGHFRVTVTSADGKETYLDYSAQRKFGDLKTLDLPANAAVKGDEVYLSLIFNPIDEYLRAVGDFINYDAREGIDRCDFVVTDSAGKPLATASFKLDDLAYVRGVIQMQDLPFGEYVTKMTVLGKDGKAMVEREGKFSKKDHTQFAWWNTPKGNKDRVVPPWTPVTRKGNTLGVWGREMTLGSAGLPAQITTQNRPLLAAPAQLRAQLPDGKTVTAAGADVKVASEQDWQVQTDVASTLANIDVTSRVTVEYDGMYKVEMTLTPRSPVDVQALQVVVPLTEHFADYLHACGDGIRTGFYYGFLPREKTGRIWDCYTVDSQPMVSGSFIPYVWVGSPDGGLCWFADSDQGWIPNDKVPAIELRRDGKSVDLVLNLVSAPATLDGPRTVVFAFQASPVKTMHTQWRMDSWWCGDTFLNYAYPDGKGSLIWQSLPFTTDPDACRKMVEGRHASTNSYIFGVNKYSANAVPYIEYNTMGHLATEVGYFGEAWKASEVGPLWYGKTMTDYVMWNMDKWVAECNIDGWYLDNVRPVPSDIIEAGRGYRLPDGRVQPTYNMFTMRDFFLRLRAVFADHGKTGKIVNHMTNNMIIPWNGAVDIAYDGEHHVIYPEMGKDFMDFWSLERLRVDFPGQWGTAVNFMHEYQGTWAKEDMIRVMRAYTGAIALHDALCSGNSNGNNQAFWVGRDRFGIEADDVTFTGYWAKDSGVACATKDVYVSFWQRPGKALLAVVNYGEKADAPVRVDCKALGLPPAAQCKAWDAETEEELPLAADGTVTVPLERHNYRQIIVEKK